MTSRPGMTEPLPAWCDRIIPGYNGDGSNSTTQGGPVGAESADNRSPDGKLADTSSMDGTSTDQTPTHQTPTHQTPTHQTPTGRGSSGRSPVSDVANRTPSGRTAPRRVLIVSANMGGGHDAAAAALAERVELHWPGSTIRRIDTLDVMGRALGVAFRGIYVGNVQWTPWLYQFFYDSLWRYRWFATASKAFVAAWSGRRMAGEIERFDPDLILSTYPLGSGALDWLRRHRSLAVPVGAWVTDFAPHPFWVYSDVDITFVMHDGSVPWAVRSEPRARVEVAAPPVAAGFGPGDRVAARTGLDLDPDAFVVLVSCGAYGFGDVSESVRAILAAGPRVRVIAACGRNSRLRNRLVHEFGGTDSERLRLLGWRSDMPDITRAADVVVTNAGGMTSLEALVCERPVIMYRPIAAHGVANARLMHEVGVADICHRPDELTTLIADRAGRDSDPHLAAIRRYRGQHDDGLDALAAVAAVPPGPMEPSSRPEQPRLLHPETAGRRGRAWPLRAADAFFLHVDADTVSQQVGAIVTTEPGQGTGPLTADVLRATMAVNLDRTPALGRRVLRHGRLTGPGWVAAPVDLRRHVTEVRVADADEARAAMDRFWSEPMSMERPPWQVLLVRSAAGEQTTIGFKFHHALGDAISLITSLDRLLETPDHPERRRDADGRARPRPRVAETLVRARRTARGLADLAVHAGAPRSGLNAAITDPRRGILTLTVSSKAVRALSQGQQARSSEIVLGLVAEALHRCGLAGSEGGADTARTMLPVAMGLPSGRRTSGNRTGVVAVDLPVGEMPLADRIACVRRDLHRHIDLGQPEAGAFVMRALGTLPAPLHGWLARHTYTSRYFNLLTSYIPGPPRPRQLAGHRITAIHPVVALAAGVRLGVGIMRYAGTTSICLIFDESLRSEVLGLRNALELILDEYGVPAGAAVESGKVS